MIGLENQAKLDTNKEKLGESHIKTSQTDLQIKHYWQYIEKKLPNLDTVKFVKFNKRYEECDKMEKGYAWCLCALYQIEDLETVFKEMVSDIDYNILYDMEDSYIWK